MRDCTVGCRIRVEKCSSVHHLDYFEQPPVNLYPETAFPSASLIQMLHGEDVTHLKNQQCWSKWFTDGPIKTIVFNGRVRRKQCDRDWTTDLCDVKLHPFSPRLQTNWMKSRRWLNRLPISVRGYGQGQVRHATVLSGWYMNVDVIHINITISQV